MAPARKKSEEKPELRLRMSVDDARKRIVDRIAAGQAIKAQPIESEPAYDAVRNEYYKWNDYNAQLLKQMFTNSDLADEYSGFFGFIGGQRTFREKVAELYEDIDGKVHRLDSISERLELIPLSEGIQDKLDSRPSEGQMSTTQVFLVHGHDDAARESVARFLEKLKLEVVILHEQPNAGMTIIEKLEKYSNVGFAVVLLTPDDEGRERAEGQLLKSRARQNVVLELGYFVGKLGRNRVLALHNGVDELPSDYLGVVFESLDPRGAWRFALGRELKNAKFDIDMNDAM